MKSFPFSLAAVALLILVGCVEYDERIDLDDAGHAGSVRIHLAVAEQVVAWPKPRSNEFEQVFPLTVADLRKELDSPALHLLDARAEQANDMRHLYVLCRLDDASRLSESSAFAQRKISVKPLPNGWSFSQELTVSEKSLTSKDAPGILQRLETSLGHDRLVAMLSKYHVSFSVSAPESFSASSPDGSIHRSNTVVWRKSLADLLFNEQSWKMEASFVKAH